MTPQTVPLPLISRQCLLSRAEPGIVPDTFYLPPNAPVSQCVCVCETGRALLPPPPSTHHPLEPPRDTNCSQQRGRIGVRKGRLGQGRKFWVRGGNFGSEDEALGQTRKIWVRGRRFGLGTIELAEELPNFLPSCYLLWSQEWCWATADGCPHGPMFPRPHIPMSPRPHVPCAYLEHSCL